MAMAEKQDGYKLISVDSNEEDEVVFHAGTHMSRIDRHRKSPLRNPLGAKRRQPLPPPSRTKVNQAEAAGCLRLFVCSGWRGLPGAKTAQERQRERERAQRRQLAEEIAATEADLNKAGKMSKPQVAIIIVCIVLLIVTVVYVVSSFIS